MTDVFKIMHSTRRKFIPWDLIAPHEAQAESNHSQSLARLNSRGGLSPSEAVAVLEDRQWKSMPVDEAEDRLEEIVLRQLRVS